MTNNSNDIIEYYKSKIMEYKNKRNEKCSIDNVVKYVSEQKNIDDAIRIAVGSRDRNGKMHSHQRHVQKIAYGKFTEVLLQVKEKIVKATDFDQLFSIIAIEGKNIYGVGEMLIYDTAFRIGTWRKIFPETIYIHAGTRIGLSNLLKRKIYEQTINKKDLPEPFRSCDLTPGQLEDFFCINKDMFSNSNKRKGRRSIC